MKKGIFLIWFLSFMPYMVGAQQATDTGAPLSVSSGAQAEAVTDIPCWKDEDKSESCKRICEAIYSRKDSEDCQFLPYSLVQSLEKVHNAFKDANVVALRQMDSMAFETYIKIDIEPFFQNIEGYNPTESKEILAWLIHPFVNVQRPPGKFFIDIVEDIFDRDADFDFTVLQSLLGLSPYSNISKVDKWVQRQLSIEPYEWALMQPIYEYEDTEGIFRTYTFFDLIISNNNEKAGEWVHRFIEREKCRNRKNNKLCVLRAYCVLSNAMGDRVAEDLFDFYYFRQFINTVIEKGVSKSHWSRPDFESYGDLDLWHRDLCAYNTERRRR